MIQKGRKPSTEAIRADMESRGYFVTSEKIFGFISEAMRRPYKPPSEANVRAVGALLFEMAEAAKAGAEWESFKQRVGVKKLKAKRFDPARATTDSPAFALVLEYVRRRLTYKEAVAEFKATICHASDRQIESWIAQIKPRAEQVAIFTAALDAKVTETK